MNRLEKGEIVTIKIVDFGNEGEGIGKIDNFIVFVPYGVIEDVLKIRITKSKKSFAYGEIIEIVEPSQYRENGNICKYFKKCGGCSIAHVKYTKQLEYKKNKVDQNLKRIGFQKAYKSNEIIGTESNFNYRNKAQFPFGIKDGKIVIGYYEKKSHNIIDAENCCICHININKVMNLCKIFFNNSNFCKYTVYDENTGKGLLRKLIIKTSFSTNETMICLVINGEKLPFQKEFVDKMAENKNITSIILNINKNKNGPNMGDKNIVIGGKSFITDVIDGVKFQISPLSFYQVNPIQTEKLYKNLLECLNLHGDETIIDAYCGIGTISLLLAKKAKKIIGIEIVEQAIENAKINAIENNIINVEFVLNSVENSIKNIINSQVKIDVIVVDPPRKGLEDSVIDSITNSGCKKIAYISCDSGTLARDLKKICDNGYVLCCVTAVDMFCHSSHVESVVLLARKDT